MKKRLFSCLPLLFGMLSVMLFGAEPAKMPAARSFAARGNRIFQPLPAGAVMPTGWLLDWAQAAKKNYTARMDQIDPEFSRAWTADFSPTCPVGDWGHGSWSYEGGGYWFDGLVRLAYQLNDPELISLIKRRLAPVLDNSSEESIGHFYWLNRKNRKDLESVRPDYGWGLWANGLYGRAMTEYHAATRDPKALRAMQRSDDSSSYRCITLTGLGSPPNNAWNACEDYLYSGNKGVAETLDRFYSKKEVDWPGLWEPYRTRPNEKLLRGEKFYPEDWVMRFHGVFFNETLAGWAAGSFWTGRPEFLETAVAWQNLMDKKCLQPYGAIVEDELYGPTGAYRSTETCTLAAELWRRIMLFSLTGEGSDADKTERLFFNAGAGTVTRDFSRHVYFQQPNRVTKDSFICSWGNKSNCTFQQKHYPLCCTAGINRIVPTYIQYLWMATPDDGLAAVLYAPNNMTTEVRGTAVSIQSKTDYPFNETISMTIMPKKPTAFPLTLRIPDWCKNPSVLLNDQSIEIKKSSRGFLRLERIWNANDKLTLIFPMIPRLEQGVDRNAKKQEMPKGGAWGNGSVLGQFADSDLSAVPYADIAFGPLLFVLPVAEKDENTPIDGAQWQFALDPEKVLESVDVIRKKTVRPWNWPVDAPIQLKISAIAAKWKHDVEFPRLPLVEEMSIGQKNDITLVPYGCAKLRVSMFPVISVSHGTAVPNEKTDKSKN